LGSMTITFSHISDPEETPQLRKPPEPPNYSESITNLANILNDQDHKDRWEAVEQQSAQAPAMLPFWQEEIKKLQERVASWIEETEKIKRDGSTVTFLYPISMKKRKEGDRVEIVP
ncbi:MAG: hypothetical protein Q9174_005906, partial [Haloplaca sp. 1 TL-2023]